MTKITESDKLVSLLLQDVDNSNLSDTTKYLVGSFLRKEIVRIQTEDLKEKDVISNCVNIFSFKKVEFSLTQKERRLLLWLPKEATKIAKVKNKIWFTIGKGFDLTEMCQAEGCFDFINENEIVYISDLLRLKVK